uniref:Uncharacterized protein n=1 Tax=Arundo donax TaxID=35708 RepID=A0A0A8Z9E2_ARUDO
MAAKKDWSGGAAAAGASSSSTESSGSSRPAGTTGLANSSVRSGNSRGSASGQLRRTMRRQDGRCTCQKRSASDTPEALGRKTAAMASASWRR